MFTQVDKITLVLLCSTREVLAAGLGWIHALSGYRT